MNIVEKPSLPKIFKSEINRQALAQAVRVYLGNQRSATAHAKTRSQVNKTTRKMYKQKGTGNARHGSSAAPIFVGGGVAFGPTGEQNHTLKFPTSMKRIALRSALSAKASDKKIIVVADTDKANGKTTQAAKIIPIRSLVVADPTEVKFIRACKNISHVSISYPKQLTAYIVLANHNLVISERALAEMAKLYV